LHPSGDGFDSHIWLNVGVYCCCISCEELGVGGVSYLFDLFDERLRVFKVSWCGCYYLLHKVIHNFDNCFRYAVDSAYDRSVFTGSL
jgi:hypothetical protein